MSDCARINAVSPSFCLAKWLQVTIDLVHGTTHSCHHPQRHRIPLDELRANPSALHNTQFKKEQRRQMLAGERPAECGYCWDMEDAGVRYSDRIIKSTDPWALPHLERIAAMPWQADVRPTYLEVMLDDLCHFSCAYCIADVSTSIAEEMRRFGPYRVDNQTRMPLDPRAAEPNPYVEAFWQWLPEISTELEVLRVTGGEPLLTPRFDQMLQYLETSRHPKLSLAINTNLGYPARRLDPMVARLKALRAQGRVRAIEIYTSVDAYGPPAEYIRHGMRYEQWRANIERIFAEIPEAPVVIMCTLNLLSLGSLDALIRDVAALKRRGNLTLDIACLKGPNYLRADLADRDLLARLETALATMRADAGFNAHEIEKLANIARWASAQRSAAYLQPLRRDFFSFIQEYDRRKGTRFLAVFPEYRGLFALCKEAAFQRLGTEASRPVAPPPA